MFTGIVEGFYGKPYSHTQRDILIDYISRLHSPAYMYAPKNDRFHRLDWRQPYPPGEWNRLSASMSDAGVKGVSFIFAVSPWRFDPSETGLLRRKIVRALDAGASGIAVLFDDIPDAATPELAGMQIEFASGALAGLDCPVTVCPSIYCTELMERLDGREYIHAWKASCPAGWGALWTGDKVISRDMNRSTVSRGRELLGGEPVIWDNILADDYCLRRTYLADLQGRTGTGCSYLLNPSSIFPVALHGAMELAAASGAGREWPEELGPHLPAWELLAEFHHLPWVAGETGAELLKRVENGFLGSGETEALNWLEESMASLSELSGSLESVEGGFDLIPVVLDLHRFMSILARAIRDTDAGSRRELLTYLLLQRLPYEHPLASMTIRLLLEPEVTG